MEVPEHLRAAGTRLVLDVEARDLAAQFDAAGVEAILLKGPAIARWLYPSGDRFYGDIDLLIPSPQLEAAGEILRARGYERRLDLPDTPLPEDRATYAFSWRKGDMLVELHQTLVGVRTSPATTWTHLSRNTTSLDLEGRSVHILNKRGRALHLALHAAQHGTSVEKSLEDLRRGLGTVDREAWADAYLLAQQVDAVPAFASGLALLAEGRRLLAELDIPSTPSLDVALHASGARPSALSLEWFLNLPMRSRFRWAARKIVPPPAFMRRWHSLARRGIPGLVISYLWRPFWLSKELVLGYRERRRTRSTLPPEE